MPFNRRTQKTRNQERSGRSFDKFAGNKFATKKRRPRVNNPQQEVESKETAVDVLVGRNAVREALKNTRQINKLLIAENAHGGSLGEILAMAREQKIIIHKVSQAKLNTISTEHNQGVIAYTPPVDYADIDDVLVKVTKEKDNPFFILLDELEDPHNLGAVLRTADAVGADGVIIGKRRSCPLSSTVAKTSAGALEYVPVMRVTNIVQTINMLKEKGFWVVGADAAGDKLYYEADLRGPILLVVGSEGKGISQLVKKSCDFLVKIPMCGQINSLNASNAAAILMYEVLKQRSE